MRIFLSLLTLFSFCAPLRAELTHFRTSDDSRAVIKAWSWGMSLGEAGEFSSQVIDGQRVAGVTASLWFEERDGHLYPQRLVGNIWCKTASVSSRKLLPDLGRESVLKALDAEDLLHHSKHPRMHFYSKEIKANGDGSFQILAEMDIKDKRGIPVEFRLVFPDREEDEERGLGFSVHSVTSERDEGHADGRISRARLGLTGMKWAADDGLRIEVSGTLHRAAADAPVEAGRLPEVKAASKKK